jgi:Uma2 family endonuclease
MTEAEFLAWVDEDTRAEWVNGEVIMMAPASSEHAFLNFWLGRVLADYVDYNHLGVVCGQELMVRLAPARSRRVPDTMFVQTSRESIIKPNHLEGPPDLIIEVVSPESIARDYREKYLDYAKASVNEYWIVDPMAKTIEVHTLVRGKKYEPIAETDGKFCSKVVRGFYLCPQWLFGVKRKPVLEVLKGLGVRV